MPKSRRDKSTRSRRDKSNRSRRDKSSRFRSAKSRRSEPYSDLEKMLYWKRGDKVRLGNIGINCSFLKFVKPGTSERPIKRIDKYGSRFQIMLDVSTNILSWRKILRYSRNDMPVYIDNISIAWYIVGIMGSHDDATIILEQKPTKANPFLK